MKTIIIKNIEDYEDAINNTIDFIKENMQYSEIIYDYIGSDDFLKDNDTTEFNSLLISFISDSFNFDNNLNDDDILKIKNDFGDIYYYSYDIEETISYIISDTFIDFENELKKGVS